MTTAWRPDVRGAFPWRLNQIYSVVEVGGAGRARFGQFQVLEISTLLNTASGPYTSGSAQPVRVTLIPVPGSHNTFTMSATTTGETMTVSLDEPRLAVGADLSRVNAPVHPDRPDVEGVGRNIAAFPHPELNGLFHAQLVRKNDDVVYHAELPNPQMNDIDHVSIRGHVENRWDSTVIAPGVASLFEIHPVAVHAAGGADITMDPTTILRIPVRAADGLPFTHWVLLYRDARTAIVFVTTRVVTREMLEFDMNVANQRKNLFRRVLAEYRVVTLRRAVEDEGRIDPITLRGPSIADMIRLAEQDEMERKIAAGVIADPRASRHAEDDTAPPIRSHAYAPRDFVRDGTRLPAAVGVGGVPPDRASSVPGSSRHGRLTRTRFASTSKNSRSQYIAARQRRISRIRQSLHLIPVSDRQAYDAAVNEIEQLEMAIATLEAWKAEIDGVDEP